MYSVPMIIKIPNKFQGDFTFTENSGAGFLWKVMHNDCVDLLNKREEYCMDTVGGHNKLHFTIKAYKAGSATLYLMRPWNNEVLDVCYIIVE